MYTTTAVLMRLILVDQESVVQVLSTQLKGLLNILRTADQAALLFLVVVLIVWKLNPIIFSTELVSHI